MLLDIDATMKLVRQRVALATTAYAKLYQQLHTEQVMGLGTSQATRITSMGSQAFSLTRGF